MITAFLEYRRSQYKISTSYPRTTLIAGLNMIFSFWNRFVYSMSKNLKYAQEYEWERKEDYFTHTDITDYTQN
ncbi:hypothetical protein [Bacteroidetes bacterium endosymbiont of Geopemphigus sp.]|uniref:hypothetical protein n=1 Tax=Bacteroidetes bacterium endosymbiont of Geopemphigus sp. TaxID=2047937 RepID=UPI000CD068A4|nr:hypothetical protein [Bacteroidetes bacterium endosymbiont of Geopemphigus sp.]